MADVDVKNQSSSQASKENAQRGETSLQRQQSSWLNPGLNQALGPAEFFNSNPFTLMRRMNEEMDRTFGQFFGQRGGGAGGWYPEIEIMERDGQLHVQTDLPGLRPEDVKVEITGDVLTISGERKSEQEYREGKAYGRNDGMASSTAKLLFLRA
jgi:Hsp20/alpha crystallin family